MEALRKNKKGKRVFVAMSGGVDSSVVAAMLKRDGYDVEGVTMCFNIENPKTKRPSCCGVEGINDARKICKKLGIPHHVLDYAQDIEELVIQNFIDEYINGRTPNPCVRCNQFLKFGRLLEMACESGGADYMATGHYARLIKDEAGAPKLMKAVDQQKDQSYFLYSTPKDILGKLMFPLGLLKKAEVRALAKDFGLDIYDKAESQDICFVPETGYKKFIEQHVPQELLTPGYFLDHTGKVIGKHKGIIHYTVGQRDKLGLALGVPVYVLKIDKETNTVHVGPEKYLYASGLLAREVNWMIEEIDEKMEVTARIRYNACEVRVTVEPLEADGARVIFHQPQKAITPGQSVVFNAGDLIIGGGIIDEVIE